jgi:hypothetical protein
MDRPLLRGDTLVFIDSVVRDQVTGVLTAVPAGQQPPPGSVPVDIAGYTITFTAKYEFPDSDNRAVSQLDNLTLGGVVILTANPGKFSVTMPASATRGFADSPIVLLYDVQAQDPAGRVSTIDLGTITVSPDVTRSSV